MGKKYDNHEDEAQRLVIVWAGLVSLDRLEVGVPDGRHLSDYLIAYPGGGWRSPAEAAIMKALGVRAGVFDLFLPLPVPPSAGLWVEMKKDRQYFPSRAAADRAVSDNQVRWGELMIEAGYHTTVAYGFEEAASAIAWYIGLDPATTRRTMILAQMRTRNRRR